MKKGGWFVRITVLVIVVIWLIPTIGVLVTSFRPESLVDTTGWWTAFGHPFRAGQWTLENYRTALDSGGFQNALLNSLAVTIPSTVMPITIAAFAAYAFSWMEFRGRYVLFVLDRRPAGRAVADGVDPDPAAVHAGLGRRGSARSSPTSTSMAPSSASGSRIRRSACRLRSTCYATTSASLPSSIVESAQASTAPTTSRSSGGSSCRCRCRRSRRSRSSSSSGSGTTCSSPTCSSAARQTPGSSTIALAEPGRCARRELASAHVGRLPHDAAAARSCSSRCSATSCAASPPDR